MNREFNIAEIDWNNPNVDKVFEHFKTIFGKKDETIKQIREENTQIREENTQQAETIKQLREEILQLKKTKHKSSNVRSYNTREFKEYPHPTNNTNKQSSNTPPITIHCIADQDYCPCCGNELSDVTDHYDRTVEDIINGKFVNTGWRVNRRYCKTCKKQQTAKIPWQIPNEHFGPTTMSQIIIMRCLGISFDKIQKLLDMIYGRFIPKSTLIHICNVVHSQCTPVYSRLMENLKYCCLVFGDETGWFYNGRRYWVSGICIKRLCCLSFVFIA